MPADSGQGGLLAALLSKAKKICGGRKDRAGKPLKVLSPEMQEIFAGFDGKISFQRSPTHWVNSDYVRVLACNWRWRSIEDTGINRN